MQNNMDAFWAYVKKHWVGAALLVIVVGAIFVRTYHYQDWLYFKMDQSRDAILLSKAVNNGPADLPLLGARAGAVKLKHGFLRLGPIDYYFQYLSGVIFHSTSAYVYAYPDLLFSILTLPLLFLLARLYFSKKNALLITAMYAFSFIIIEYSRFAWNPNSLQFFLLLSFYGLLRMLNETDSKKKMRWLVVWATGITIGSQLHFFGFFSLLGVSGLMLIAHFELWKKTSMQNCFSKENFGQLSKYAATGILVFLVFYTPVVISDIYKNGENTKNFFEAMISKPANKPFSQKIVKTASENLKYYCLITTSQCYGSSMKKDYPAIAFTALILLAGIVLIVRKLRASDKLTAQKKDFLILLLFWLGVYTILTIPVAFQLRPRFFIVTFAIPFIFLGLIFEYLEEKVSFRYALSGALILSAIVIGWNSHGTYQWFKEQAASQKKALIVKRTLILKAKDGITLGQLQGAADWMYAHHQQGQNLYYYINPEHQRPIEFLLLEKHDSKLNFSLMKVNGDPKAQYFAITKTKDGLKPFEDKIGTTNVAVLDSKQFGQITAWEVTLPLRQIDQNFVLKSTGSEKDDRIYWKDVFADVFGLSTAKTKKNKSAAN